MFYIHPFHTDDMAAITAGDQSRDKFYGKYKGGSRNFETIQPFYISNLAIYIVQTYLHKFWAKRKGADWFPAKSATEY
jgi:hypothetical protein